MITFVKDENWMKKILFITSRNIISTCGELRLIKNRANVLKEEYGYTTDFIAYRLRKKIQNEDVGGQLTILRNPYDRLRLYSMIKQLVLSGDYNCVILSGITMNLAPYIKRMDWNCKIVLDIHGTVEEYVEFRNNTLPERLIFGFLYKHTKRVEKKVVPLADGILAVSHSLADYYKKLSKRTDIRTFIVPCAILDTISRDEYVENRKRYREKYNLLEEDQVFVYSGGASPWQCVDESVELFQRIREISGDSCKMLLFSGNKKMTGKYKGIPGIMTDSLSPDEVMETLCVGDFGIMLRGDYATNNYAFPNKFLEYVGSGLRVITTPYVYDVRDYINEFSLGFIVDLPIKSDNVNKICAEMKADYDMEDHFKRRDDLVKKCSFKETLKSFDDFIGDIR